MFSDGKGPDDQGPQEDRHDTRWCGPACPVGSRGARKCSEAKPQLFAAIASHLVLIHSKNGPPRTELYRENTQQHVFSETMHQACAMLFQSAFLCRSMNRFDVSE